MGKTPEAPTAEAAVTDLQPKIDAAAFRQKILSVEGKPEIREVFLPAWGFSVYVRGLTAEQRDRWEAEQVAIGKSGQVTHNLNNIRASLVARCLCTADGDLIMRPEDVQALGRKAAREIDQLFAIAKELSGVSQKDVDDLEGALKNDRSGDGW